MLAIRNFAEDRPLLFVLALAIAQPLIALPFVAAFRLVGEDIVGLRLLIPAIQSGFVFSVILLLGWRTKSGLTTTVRNIHLYIYPGLIAFVPVVLYGTVEISWGWIAFYGTALIFTGISEEGFARGIAIPALMRWGKWVAVVLAAAIFSAGHLTNIFFEDFRLNRLARQILRHIRICNSLRCFVPEDGQSLSIDLSSRDSRLFVLDLGNCRPVSR